ncbi:hypothetical protein [Oceanobacillus oncorhynchi]|uniref:hypothetical protein n=1 Tax=Oceanobacillus oncorhynchi TaxID=545501 RepID=UPI0034D62174
MNFIKSIKDEDKFMSMMFIFIVALFNAMTALFFITIEYPVDSPTYGKMAEVINLNIYGLLLFISAIFFFLSLFQRGTPMAISMLIGGIIGGLLVSFYTSASTLGAANVMLPIRYGIMACSCFIIAAVGGVSLWKTKKKTRT